MIEQVAELNQALLSKAQQALRKRSWKEKIMDKLMAMCMADDGLRTQLFRFIDVFPVLKNNRAVANHFLSYVGPHKKSFPWPIRKALWFTDKPITNYLAGFVIGLFVKLFAGHFIINSVSRKKIEITGQKLRARGYDTTWDIVGEDSLTKDEAFIFRKRYLDLIERLGNLKAPAGFSHNVSIKLSALVPKLQWDAINFDSCVNAVSDLLAELLRAAKKCGVTINLDMEQYAVRDLTLAIFKKTLEQQEFNGLEVGAALQSYLTDAESSLDCLLAWCWRGWRPMIIRLVKGAYWDYEVINSQQQGWPIPVLTNKSETDRQFERMAVKILRAQKYLRAPVRLACASHNLESIAYVMRQIEEMEIDKTKNEFQVLYGMGDPIREAIVRAGYPARVYTPYGELIPGMAYFVRRLLENTSQQSFLGLNFLKGGKK